MTKERLGNDVDVFQEYFPHRAADEKPKGEVDPEGLKM
jgi:hypothetical protein